MYKFSQYNKVRNIVHLYHRIKVHKSFVPVSIRTWGIYYNMESFKLSKMFCCNAILRTVRCVVQLLARILHADLRLYLNIFLDIEIYMWWALNIFTCNLLLFLYWTKLCSVCNSCTIIVPCRAFNIRIVTHIKNFEF